MQQAKWSETELEDPCGGRICHTGTIGSRARDYTNKKLITNY